MVMGLNTERRGSADPFAAHPLSVSASIGYQIHDFLAREALLLDHRRYAEWTALLAKDLEYRCPGRPDDERSYRFTLWHLRRQPASVAAPALARTHRFLSNVIVSYGDHSDEFAVSSYVLVNYSNPGESEVKVFAVERRDCIRRSSDTFWIVRRDLRMAPLSPETREMIGPL